jgi:hypothetical protein
MQRAVPSALRLLQQACHGGCWQHQASESLFARKSATIWGAETPQFGPEGAVAAPILHAGMMHSTPLGALAHPPPLRCPRAPTKPPSTVAAAVGCNPPRCVRPFACCCCCDTGPAGGAAAASTRSLSSHTFSGFGDAPPAAGSKSISIKVASDGANVSVHVTAGGASAKASYPAASIKT